MPDLTDLADLRICTRCTGRIFASVDGSLTNLQRGNMVFFSYRSLNPGIDFSEIPESQCPLCRGIFSDFERYYHIVMDELGDTGFNTMLVGSVFDQDTVTRESEIHSRFGSRGESIKKEFNREFGKYLSDKTGKDVDFSNPDVTIVVNTQYDFARIDVRSIFISGRYNKYRRDLPQTRWIHKPGNMESVEYYIGSPLKDVTGGENYFLHAAGREDVDVRMLGNGRDFVVEITNPRRREPDLKDLEERINSGDNGVRVNDLGFCSRELVKEVKSYTFDKIYRVRVRGGSDFDGEALEKALKNITGKVIYQRTPLRVAVRRADLIRERSVRESVVEAVEGNMATVLVTAQSGMYIKELINGDNGRTEPSLSSEYGSSLEVAELDVVEIKRGN